MSQLVNTLATVGVAAGGFAAVLYPALSRVMARNERHRQQATDTAIKAAVDGAKSDLTALLDHVVTKLQEDTSERFDKNDAASEKAASAATSVDRRLTKIEAQFGPNGGGLREQATDDRNRLARVEAALLTKGAS